MSNFHGQSGLCQEGGRGLPKIGTLIRWSQCLVRRSVLYSAEMGKKLIVDVVRLRNAGKVVPRHNLAFVKPFVGVLTLNEERIVDLNRHSLVATLRHPDTGAPVPGLNPLLDARVVRATNDEWVLTGIERVADNLIELDCAQSWLVRLDQLIVTPDQP